MTTTLSDAARMTIMNRLFEEAQAQCREAGCTCVPSWRLTPNGIGPHKFKAWISDHTDDCALATMTHPEMQ